MPYTSCFLNMVHALRNEAKFRKMPNCFGEILMPYSAADYRSLFPSPNRVSIAKNWPLSFKELLSGFKTSRLVWKVVWKTSLGGGNSNMFVVFYPENGGNGIPNRGKTQQLGWMLWRRRALQGSSFKMFRIHLPRLPGPPAKRWWEFDRFIRIDSRVSL